MGPDAQLERAVQALAEDVAAERAKGSVKIVPAATKRRAEKRAVDAAGRR